MRRFIPIFLGSLTLWAGVMRGGEISFAADPFTVSVQREPINTTEPIFRAFMTVRNDKFTFIVPQKFSTSGDPAHGRLQLKTLEGGSFMSLAFVEGSTARGLTPEAYRESLLERYPGGKILKQFPRPVNGRTGTMFDLEWTSASGFAQKTRVAYFPTSAGVIELASTSSAKKFKEAQADLNGILGTFNGSVDGKLVVHHLAGAN